MEVKSFRIKNYRSIKDSGVCYLSGDNITILAGKNESGKTAILEALEDFNKDKVIRDEAVPIQNQEAKPEIAVTFEINKKTLTVISDRINFKIETTKSHNVEIIKKYPNEFFLSNESLKSLGIKDEQLKINDQNEIRGYHRRISGILTQFPGVELPGIGGVLPELDLDDISKFLDQLQDFRNKTRPNLSRITDDKIRNEFTKALDSIISKISDIVNKLRSSERTFIDQIKQWIPNFILFSSFEDIFPSEVSFAEAPNNELIKDLSIISDLNLDLIRSGTITQKASHKDQLNVRLQEDYEKFWTQDYTNIIVDWESDKLIFLVKEGTNFFPPNMRSKGWQWHLAFYVRVSARAKEDISNIILIDEPGLYLHAKAQEDVLEKFEDSAKDAPIIFSTHSPYLIKIDKLNRIRLLSRTDEEGTRISNKIHAGADKETLTPIITAIGLDLSVGLDIAKNNNVIVEGISDYYYLSAFKELLNFTFKKEIHFIPSVGADKFDLLVPLMIGWGLNYCTVLDNDRKGKQIERRLLRDFGHNGIKIMFVSENNDEEMEDLFESVDFLKYILKEDSKEVSAEKRNAQILKQKDKNFDKVLLAKSFFETMKAEDVSLSEGTINNFKNLLEKINNLMFA